MDWIEEKIGAEYYIGTTDLYIVRVFDSVAFSRFIASTNCESYYALSENHKEGATKSLIEYINNSEGITTPLNTPYVKTLIRHSKINKLLNGLD